MKKKPVTNTSHWGSTFQYLHKCVLLHGEANNDAVLLKATQHLDMAAVRWKESWIADALSIATENTLVSFCLWSHRNHVSFTYNKWRFLDLGWNPVCWPEFSGVAQVVGSRISRHAASRQDREEDSVSVSRSVFRTPSSASFHVRQKPARFLPVFYTPSPSLVEH